MKFCHWPTSSGSTFRSSLSEFRIFPPRPHSLFIILLCFRISKKTPKTTKKKGLDIGCNAAPLSEMEEENGMYTLWSMFNVKIILNCNTLLRGSACCVYQVDPSPPQFLKSPNLENGTNVVSIDKTVFCCVLFCFFFFLSGIRERLSFVMKCISVHKIIWWYLIQCSSYAVFPLLQEPPFCLSSARRGEKKSRQCAWCQ